MFNQQRNLMKLSRFPAFCSVVVLVVGICTSKGQTNGPLPQNAPRAAPSNGVRGSNVRPNNSNPHCTVPVGRQMLDSVRPAGCRPKCKASHPRAFGRLSTLARQLNPRLTAMRIQQRSPTDNVPPNGNLLPRGGIAQTPLSTTDDHRAVRTDDLKPTNEILMKREISEGFETIETPRSAQNGDLQPVVRDSANRDFKQHKVKRDRQTGRNWFSYSDALRHNWHEWHNRDWWRQHCNHIVFVTGGYYFLNASYWYPAYGYDPLNSYYDYDGPIYTYGDLLPDQVIANVQALCKTQVITSGQ